MNAFKLPSFEIVDQKIAERKQQQRNEYLKKNCDAIVSALASPPRGTPPTVSLCSVDVSNLGDWDDTYAFFDDCNADIVWALARGGFHVKTETNDRSRKFPSCTMTFLNLLSGPPATPPASPPPQNPLLAPLLVLSLTSTRAAIAANADKGAIKLQALVDRAIASHQSTSRQMKVLFEGDAWVAYAAVAYKEMVERAQPMRKVNIQPDYMTIS